MTEGQKFTPLQPQVPETRRRESLSQIHHSLDVLNRANFGPPNTTVFASGTTSASAGLITTLATNPRQIQFGLKLMFQPSCRGNPSARDISMIRNAAWLPFDSEETAAGATGQL